MGQRHLTFSSYLLKRLLTTSSTVISFQNPVTLLKYSLTIISQQKLYQP